MLKKLLLTTTLCAVPLLAQAADLPVRTPAPEPVAMAPIFTWTGFYVGAHVGYGWSDHSMRNSSPPGPDSRNVSITADGVLGGVQAGYDWQFGSLVVGIVADGSFSDMKGRFVDALPGPPPGPPFTTTASINWMASVRARAGFLITPAMLAYAHGGVAFAETKGSWIANPPGGGPGPWQGRGSDTRTGWTIGGGLEYKLTANLSTFVEYAYTDLGSQTFSNPPGPPGPAVSFRHNIDLHTVKVGLNYKFGGPAAAVVAKY